jgi:E3 ubiquitin-protein ligase RAD18
MRMQCARWVTIYNANLDRSKSHRKSQLELRVDLKKWEEDRKGKKSTVNDLEAHQVRNPFFLLVSAARLRAHIQKTHRAEFAKLVEAARPKENAGVVPCSPVRTPERRVEHDVLVLDSEEEGDI